MILIRWTAEADDSAEYAGWQSPALILSSLFLNFLFWFWPAHSVWFSGPCTNLFVALGVVTALVLALFFLCPALAAHEANYSLYEVAAASFGSIPAMGFRICCAVLSLTWIVRLSLVLPVAFLGYTLQRSLSGVYLSGIYDELLGGIFLLFFFATQWRDLRTAGRSAFFSDKLGVALLIAAAVRMHAYLPSVWHDAVGSSLAAESIWFAIAEPLATIAPLALLAADFGRNSRSRKEVAFIGIFGLVLPMAGTLLAVALIQAAAHHWRHDLGGLANISLALWGDDSKWYQPQWMSLALITTFGFARFSVRSFRIAAQPLFKDRGRRANMIALALILAVTLYLSKFAVFIQARDYTSTLLASAAAILSADYLTRRWREERVRLIDWLALTAWLAGWVAGLTLASWVSSDYNIHLATSVLAPYTASFVLCLVGRALSDKTRCSSCKVVASC